ncbi:hypothetical protein B0E37_06065 [Streptomyces sp. MH192]|nr:hypothetical protein [Streptomyces sp. MH192]MCF0103756.1 hypothetical protein [Streptomyces sp. MH191]
MQHADQQGAPVPGGRAGEGVAGVTGVAVLDADEALVRLQAPCPGQQAVGVLDLEGLLAARREVGGPRPAVAAEVVVLQPVPGEQGQVVGGGDLPLVVEAVGAAHLGVQGLEVGGPGLHLRDGLRDAAVHVGEHVHRVVAGAQEDAEPQLLDGVGDVLLDADEAGARRHVRDLLPGHLVPVGAVELAQHGVREQHLQRGRRGQVLVRVEGREDLSALVVGDQPGAGGELGGHVDTAPHLEAGKAEPLPADGGGGVRGSGGGRGYGGGQGDGGGEAEHRTTGERGSVTHSGTVQSPAPQAHIGVTKPRQSRPPAACPLLLRRLPLRRSHTPQVLPHSMSRPRPTGRASGPPDDAREGRRRGGRSRSSGTPGEFRRGPRRLGPHRRAAPARAAPGRAVPGVRAPHPSGRAGRAGPVRGVERWRRKRDPRRSGSDRDAVRPT